MRERINNEPVMIIVALLAMANLWFGLDADVVREVIETAALLVGGAVARSKVTPTNKLTQQRWDSVNKSAES